MTDSSRYAGVAGRLSEAVEALAISASPIQERLEISAERLIHLDPSEFPDADRQTFTDIKRALTSQEPVANEGSMAATTSRLTDAEAEEIAKAIFRLDATCRPIPT